MFYGFAWTVCRFILLTVRRMEILGSENIPGRGGLVLASNHRSYWDPVIVGCALPKTRQVRFMAKAELFAIPLLGPVVTKLGAFPVRRGGADRTAIRTALGYIDSGGIVGIFPEGTRNKSEGLLDPQLGAALLATKAGVPVVPVAILGSRGFFGKVKIIFGAPVGPIPGNTGGGTKRANRNDLAELSVTIMEKVAGLIKSGK